MRLRFEVIAVSCAGVFSGGCGFALLDLPETPTSSDIPVITTIEPKAAFGGDTLTLTVTGLDPGLGDDGRPDPARNVVQFVGGATARGFARDGEELSVVVPMEVRIAGPVSVATSRFVSAPSKATFTPLGMGHPVLGTVVSELRFRHRPVGVVDSADDVLVASTLLDLVARGTGDFLKVEGRPVAFEQLWADQGVLATRTNKGGVVSKVRVKELESTATSAEQATTDQFVVAGPPGTEFRTVGVDGLGRVTLGDWTVAGDVLSVTRRDLPVASVLGAAAGPDGTTYLVAQVLHDGRLVTTVQRVTDTGLRELWIAPGDDVTPSGPAAVVDSTHGREVVLALVRGDLQFIDVDSGADRNVKLASFAPMGDLRASTRPGRVVFTKSRDGALFEFDVNANEIAWTVQLRGEPTMLAVNAALDEIAVANDEENMVDLVQASTGEWLARMSFTMGLGSDEATGGGASAPFSYHPDAPDRTASMDVLARSAGMVLQIDPSSFQLIGAKKVAERALQLKPTPDLRTLVVHADDLGFIVGEAEVPAEVSFRGVPVAVAVLGPQFVSTDLVLVASAGGVDAFKPPAVESISPWQVLGGWAAPSDRVIVGMVASGGEVFVAMRSAGGFELARWSPDALVHGGTAAETVSLASSFGGFVGLVAMVDGPQMLFGRSASGKPASVPWDLLQAGGRVGQYSMLDVPIAAGVSPDGKYAMWMNDGAGEFVAWLVKYWRTAIERQEVRDEGMYPYSSYRLGGRGAGPAFDPSGEWMYIPVPKLDTVVIVQ